MSVEATENLTPSTTSVIAEQFRPFSEPHGAQFRDLATFQVVLRRRLEGYFLKQNLSPKGNAAMSAKIVFGLGSWTVAYACLFLPALSPWGFAGLYILQGLAQLFLLLNVMHDSNHNAVSYRSIVNRVLSYGMDLCGINSRMWRILHHGGHHSCINVHGEDDAIHARGLLRLSPYVPFKKIYKYQHLYAGFIYSLFSLDYIFIKDFRCFLAPAEPRLKRIKHSATDLILLIAGKAFYLTYMIGLPAVIGRRSVLLIASAMISMHLLVGLIAVLVFQMSHIVDSTRFLKSKCKHEDYIYHILATTADYATTNRLVTWLAGGLNHHVIHHLCPHVCHTHYGQLTKIVKCTAMEYGVVYREHATVRAALVGHYRLLKQLANPEMPAPG